MLFASKKIIGVDLGSSSIKLAQLKKTKKGAVLENFAFLPTPQTALNNGNIVDSFLLGEAIGAAHKSNGFRIKNACIGMWGTSSIVKKITMPRVEDKALAQQIRYEAQQYLPFDMEQISLEYHILPFSASDNEIDVLLVAGQNQFISEYIEVMTYAGLKCSIIDVNAIALANIFEFNHGKLSEPVALFNFGASSTQLVVLFQGEILFARDIPVGGFNFTNEISKNMGITLEEAETLKISQTNQAEPIPENTKEYMNMAMDFVTEEVRNSIDFYSASVGNFPISRVFYSGGASLTEGLIEHLSTNLKLPFEVFNPLQRIISGNKKLTSGYLDQIAPFMAVSLGLALREQKDS